MDHWLCWRCCIDFPLIPAAAAAGASGRVVFFGGAHMIQQRGRVWWNDQELPRSLSREVLCVRGGDEPSPMPGGGGWGEVGGQGCAGSVRLAPACSITKGRIVRCRRVWIKVSGVGQVGRKTGMSCGLQRANWRGCFQSINECSNTGQGFVVVVVIFSLNSIKGYF